MLGLDEGCVAKGQDALGIRPRHLAVRFFERHLVARAPNYFAVQADYEQQFVTANQQSLGVAVRRYKADYAKELSKMPALLRTASGKLTFIGRPVRGAKPSPSAS